MKVLANFIYIFIGYIIGSISPAIILSKIKGGKDIRTLGTKNAGATNVYTVYGKYWGFAVMWMDATKIVVATAISYVLFVNLDFFDNTYIHLAAIGTIIGHILPIYHKFRGGKGAACILGYFLTSMWIIVPVAVTAWIIIAVKKKNAILASLLVIATAALTYLGIEILLGMFNVEQQWLTPFYRIPSKDVYLWWINWTFMLAMCVISLGTQIIKKKMKKRKNEIEKTIKENNGNI